MATKYRVLILGASYGSLVGAKIALAGHTVRLVCLPEEVSLINAKGARVLLPVRGIDGLIELNSQGMPGDLSATGPSEADPGAHDLVVLAMQEPHYGAPEIRALIDRIAVSGKPCMSVMNMPPLAYLRRIPSIDANGIRDCYTNPGIWDNIDPALVTLCSADPQGFRPPGAQQNILQVGLPTNFKVAKFEFDDHTDILKQIAADIQAIRYDAGDAGEIELPVKLKVHDSIFAPLAKWSMTIAGNYRCVQKGGVRSIREAVHSDLRASNLIYEWVSELCEILGTKRNDMVPFDKYANAAMSLKNPSSVARALANGATRIERVDRLVQALAAQKGMQLDLIDQSVDLVDKWIASNRSQAKDCKRTEADIITN